MSRALISNAVNNAGITFKRFWATFFFAFVGTVVAIFLSETEKGSFPLRYFVENLLSVCLLGIGLSIALTLFSERNNYRNGLKAVLQLIGIGLLAAYYLFLPAIWTSVHTTRTALLIISLHCLVSFSAFIKRGSVEGFWQFNKSLFIQILVSLLYTIVLFMGIALAIMAVVSLFGLKINEKIYIDLWLVLVGIFNTWFFLSGVPSDFDELDHRTDYPKGLKIFTQFVLIPLVTLYFLILYAYMFKIIFQWALPQGLVSYLVIGFSIFGILSLLLIYPLQNLETEKWIKIYSRWFYRALIPLVILLFVAIGTRISDYGITESRYLIILLACWLAGVSIYLLINKLHNIKIIPITLCLIGALSSFGPWGAFSVSKESQLNRLTAYLIRNKVLVNGRMIKPTMLIPSEDQRELISIINYLSRAYGQRILIPFFPEEQRRFFETNNRLEIREDMKAFLDLNYTQYGLEGYAFAFAVNRPFENASLVKDYDYFFEQTFSIYKGAFSYTINADDQKIVFISDARKLNVKYRGETLSLDFKNIYEKLSKQYKKNDNYNVKESDVTFTLDGHYAKFKIVLNRISGKDDKSADGFKIENVEVRCLIKIKSKF